ncbi:MAG: ester cyclase [Thioalkalispiraceae bacterium]
MSNSNKDIIRRLYGEVMAKGNMAVADEIFAADFVDHMPIMETPDRAGLLKSVEAARKAFPDVKPEIIAEIAEGDWVSIAVYADGGAHKGEYMGIPATGNHVTWTETHFWKVIDGKIKEHYGNVSMFEIHKMLGSHDLQDKLV